MDTLAVAPISSPNMQQKSNSVDIVPQWFTAKFHEITTQTRPRSVPWSSCVSEGPGHRLLINSANVLAVEVLKNGSN